jgi:hypothetical protein
MLDQEVQKIIDNILFTIIIIVPVIGAILSLLVLVTRPLPPYAGKNGNEYMPAGKKGGPIEVED